MSISKSKISEKINFIWIDAKIGNQENTEYKRLIDNMEKYQSEFFNEMHIAEEELKKDKYKFKLLIIMISGSLFNNYEKYQLFFERNVFSSKNFCIYMG